MQDLKGLGIVLLWCDEPPVQWHTTFYTKTHPHVTGATHRGRVAGWPLVFSRPGAHGQVSTRYRFNQDLSRRTCFRFLYMYHRGDRLLRFSNKHITSNVYE